MQAQSIGIYLFNFCSNIASGFFHGRCVRVGTEAKKQYPHYSAVEKCILSPITSGKKAQAKNFELNFYRFYSLFFVSIKKSHSSSKNPSFLRVLLVLATVSAEYLKKISNFHTC